MRSVLAWRRRGRTLVLAPLVAAAGVACGGGDSTGPANVAGVYTLRTIDGDLLPVVDYLDPVTQDREEIIAGSLELRADRSFVYALDYQETINGQPQAPVEESDVGTYTLSGTRITLTGDFNDYAASVNGSAVTLLDDVDTDFSLDQLRFVK